METNLARVLDDVRMERIDGRPVAMSAPRLNHILIAVNIYNLFARFLAGKPCRPFPDGAEVRLTDRDRFIPDCMVVCDPEKIQETYISGTPDLVVEVLSPSTVRRDRGYKKNLYERCGVREYWIVNPADKSVEQYLLRDGELVFVDVVSLYPDWQLEDMTEEERAAVPVSFPCGIFPDLTVRLEDIFRLD